MAERICSIDGCTGPIECRDLCSRHYQRMRYSEKPVCVVDGCQKQSQTCGWCSMHYQRWRTHGDPLLGGRPAVVLRVCTVEGCERKQHSCTLCSTHYSRWKRQGNPTVAAARIPRSGRCSVQDCESAVGTSGMCNKHYTRWRKYGDVNGKFVRAPRLTCVACGAEKPLKRSYCSKCASAYHRRWREEHKDELKAKRAANYAANRRQILDDQLARMTPESREHRRAYLRSYYREHPELFIAQAHLRKARELAAVCSHGEGCVTPEFLAELRRGRCRYCDDPAEHADHYMPLARGGLHCRENLVPACMPCNRSKHAALPDEWEARRGRAASSSARDEPR